MTSTAFTRIRFYLRTLRIFALSASVAALLCLAPPTHAQETRDANLHTATKQELDIIKVVLKQESAWNRGDLDTFAQAYKNSPDTIFLSGRLTRGYVPLLNQYHANYPTKESMGNLAFSELEVRPLDDTFAVCLGHYHLERTKKEGGNADGVFSLVLEKTDQGWKIVVDHTT